MFDFTKAFTTDPVDHQHLLPEHDESRTFSDVLFGTGYTVTENPMDRRDFENVDCSRQRRRHADINARP